MKKSQPKKQGIRERLDGERYVRLEEVVNPDTASLLAKGFPLCQECAFFMEDGRVHTEECLNGDYPCRGSYVWKAVDPLYVDLIRTKELSDEMDN